MYIIMHSIINQYVYYELLCILRVCCMYLVSKSFMYYVWKLCEVIIYVNCYALLCEESMQTVLCMYTIIYYCVCKLCKLIMYVQYYALLCVETL